MAERVLGTMLSILANGMTCIEGGNAMTEQSGGRAPRLEGYLRTLAC